MIYTSKSGIIKKSDLITLSKKGRHSVVYGDKKYAYKIFTPKYLDELGQEMQGVFRKLQGLNCVAFLMPYEFLYDENDEFVGYKTRRIISPKDFKAIMEMDKRSFLKSVELLLKEMKLLSSLGIRLHDLALFKQAITQNFLVADLIYVSDLSLFELKDESYAFKANMKDLDVILSCMIFRNTSYKTLLEDEEMVRYKKSEFETYAEYLLNYFNVATPKEYLNSLKKIV